MLRKFLAYSTIHLLMNYIGLCLFAYTLEPNQNAMIVGLLMMIPIIPMNIITSAIICVFEKDIKNG